MDDLLLYLHYDAFHLCCGSVYRSGGVLNVKTGFGFSFSHIIDDEMKHTDFPGYDALLRNDSDGDHLFLVSDSILYFSLYPYFCSSSFGNLDDNMQAIFDLCSCYEVAVVNTYHDTPQFYLSNLHMELEEEATLESFYYLKMFATEFVVVLAFIEAVSQSSIFAVLVQSAGEIDGNLKDYYDDNQYHASFEGFLS
jgi:hypothetical protein